MKEIGNLVKRYWREWLGDAFLVGSGAAFLFIFISIAITGGNGVDGSAGTIIKISNA